MLSGICINACSKLSISRLSVGISSLSKASRAKSSLRTIAKRSPSFDSKSPARTIAAPRPFWCSLRHSGCVSIVKACFASASFLNGAFIASSNTARSRSLAPFLRVEPSTSIPDTEVALASKIKTVRSNFSKISLIGFTRRPHSTSGQTIKSIKRKQFQKWKVKISRNFLELSKKCALTQLCLAPHCRGYQAQGSGD